MVFCCYMYQVSCFCVCFHCHRFPEEQKDADVFPLFLDFRVMQVDLILLGVSFFLILVACSFFYLVYFFEFVVSQCVSM